MDPVSNALSLTDAVQNVCPILGVSMGNLSDKTTWIIWFDPSATSDQQAAAQAALNGFTPS